MNPIRIITALYIVVLATGYLQYDIIEGYFKNKFINYATIIGCFSRKEQLQTSKRFMTERIISVLSLNQIDAEQYLQSLNHLGVILDGDCKEAGSFLVESGKHNYFNERRHWLVLVSSSNFSHLFDNVEMYINSDIQVIYPKENYNHSFLNFTIGEVYTPSSKPALNLLTYREIGFYNEKDGYTIEGRVKNKYFIRKNLTGVRLKTMLALVTPIKGAVTDYLPSKANRGINSYSRFQYHLLMKCSNHYNFESEVSSIAPTDSGYRQKNGSFSGVVGALLRKEVDYGSTPLYVIQERIGAVDFGKKTWLHKAGFLFLNPQSVTSMEALVKPLSVSTWILTLASAVTIWLLLRLSCAYEENIYQQVDVSWSYLAMVIVGALCQQGMSETPRFSSGRIVTLFLFIFATLMYQFYSASLVSSLLMKRPTRIKTLKDLADSNLKAGSEDYLYYRRYLMDNREKAASKIYHEKILGPHNASNFMTAQKGIDLVSKGGYAFNMEFSAAFPIIRKTFSDKAICELRQVELDNKPAFLYTIYQRHSPYKEMFDACLHRLEEGGIITRDILFWNPPKPDCLQETVSATFNIGLDEFYPALVVLGVGIACSLLLLIYEKISFRLRHGKKERDTLIYPFLK